MTFEAPHVARGTVRLEWIGARSPLDHPLVEYRLATGQYPKHAADILRKAAVQAPIRHLGTSRRMTPDAHGIPGLSQSYEWGPRPATYVQDVEHRDADKILSSASGAEFRNLDAVEPDEPVVIAPDVDITVYTKEVIDSRLIGSSGERWY